MKMGKKDDNKTPDNCQLCGKKSDNVKTCENCKIYLCNGCSKNHKKEFPKHNIISPEIKIKILEIIYMLKILNVFNVKRI